LLEKDELQAPTSEISNLHNTPLDILVWWQKISLENGGFNNENNFAIQ
jgi:hypothetical protein